MTFSLWPLQIASCPLETSDSKEDFISNEIIAELFSTLMSRSQVEHRCFSGFHSRLYFLSDPRQNPIFSLSPGTRLAHSAPWPRFKALPGGAQSPASLIDPGLAWNSSFVSERCRICEKVKDSGSACSCKASSMVPAKVFTGWAEREAEPASAAPRAPPSAWKKRHLRTQSQHHV